MGRALPGLSAKSSNPLGYAAKRALLGNQEHLANAMDKGCGVKAELADKNFHSIATQEIWALQEIRAR